MEDELGGADEEGGSNDEGGAEVEDDGGWDEELGGCEDDEGGWEEDDDGGWEEDDDDGGWEEEDDDDDDVEVVEPPGTGRAEQPHPTPPGGHGRTVRGSLSMNVFSDELVTRTNIFHPSASPTSGHTALCAAAENVARFMLMLIGMAESTSLESASAPS